MQYTKSAIKDTLEKQRRLVLMYQVVRIIPASFIFRHTQYREILAEHSHYITAWLSCYLLHNTAFLPCHIEKREEAHSSTG